MVQVFLSGSGDAILLMIKKSGNNSDRRGIRTRFQRMLGASGFLIFFLVGALQLFDSVDDPSEMSAVWLILIGAIVSSLLGALAGPHIPRLLGLQAKNRRLTRSKRSVRHKP